MVSRKSTNAGFSLIELMIAVSIVAILAGIAIPSYSGYVTKARRSDAQQLLLDVSNKQKQYLQDARCYTEWVAGTPAPPGGVAGTVCTKNQGSLSLSKDGWNCTNQTCSNNYYDVTIAVDGNAAPPTFTATARTKGSQLGDGIKLTITQDGVKRRYLTNETTDFVDWAK